MKNTRTRCAALGALLLCLLLVSCSGVDPVRLSSERANWRLAQRCADGWFGDLPFTPHDEQLVREALADWDRALTADEKLAGWVAEAVK